MKKERLLINRNEIVQGPSPKALAAIKNFPPGHVNFYIPRYYGSVLAPKLSKQFGIPEDRIILSVGAEDLLRMVFDTLRPADLVLVHEHHFDFYHIYLQGRGVRHAEFRMKEGVDSFEFDIADCVEKIKELKPRLVLITSPNNPTGNSISYKDFCRVLAAAPKDCLIALDEAYYGFHDGYEEKKFLALLEKHSNLMLVRTFSKLYALAGMRIGYALCGKDVVKMLRYQRPRLGGSRILEEVAAAALDSAPYYRKLAKEIARERERTIRFARGLAHFKPFVSHSNVIAIRVSPEVKPFIEKEMDKASVLVCKFYAPHLLRVSVATPKYMEQFRKMLSRADKAAVRATSSLRKPVGKRPRSARYKASSKASSRRRT